MSTEIDERVKDYSRLPSGICIIKSFQDEGLEDEMKRKHCLFIWENLYFLVEIVLWTILQEILLVSNMTMYSIEILIRFISHSIHWDELYEAGLIGKNLLQGGNDYKDGGIFHGLFLALKKYCSTLVKYGIMAEHKISIELTVFFKKIR